MLGMEEEKQCHFSFGGY